MSVSLRAVVAVLVGTLVGAVAALAFGGAAQAAGAPCSGKGIDVVVDYGALGGGVAKGCASGTGGMAGDKAFQSAGYPLQYVPNQPGFVCEVAGKPAQCKMPGAGDPWWGVFWSDGTSGKWKTAMVGVNKLKVPANGSVAMVWETGKKVTKPAVAAPKASDRSATKASAATSATPKATAAKQSGHSSGNSGGGFPVWIVVVVVVVLLGAAAAVASRRRGTTAQ